MQLFLKYGVKPRKRTPRPLAFNGPVVSSRCYTYIHIYVVVFPPSTHHSWPFRSARWSPVFHPYVVGSTPGSSTFPFLICDRPSCTCGKRRCARAPQNFWRRVNPEVDTRAHTQKELIRCYGLTRDARVGVYPNNPKVRSRVNPNSNTNPFKKGMAMHPFL